MKKIPKVILVIETSRVYGRRLLRGIAKYSRIHGPWAFYREHPKPDFYMEPGFFGKSTDKERALSYLENWDADGIITREPKKVQQMIADGLPTIVTINLEEPIAGLPSIITDEVETGKMAAEHLFNHGYKHFAYCGFDNMFWSRIRGESFGKRVTEMGFETHFYKRPQSKIHSIKEEQAAIADWLKSLPQPVGLMACNDDCGQHVIEACKIAGVYVPDEVAIIGVDNDDIVCDLSDPPLSSIVLNIESAGYKAAALLDKLMAGEKTVSQTIVVQPTHVVTRQSTDIQVIDDPGVAKAVRFIRQHSKEIIQVDDVVNAVSISRRSLERQFHSVLGRSVLSEVRRARTDVIVQMLMETDQTVSQIALILGYPSASHIARYFQREKGISPLAYRKKYGEK